MPDSALRADPTEDRYDVVVIGGGVAGLTAGAFLARAGRSVLVVEADERPGGYCRSLVSGGYRFDPAVHYVMGGGTGMPAAGLLTEVLALIGASDRCELVAADPFYEARFPDLRVTVGGGRDGFVRALVEHFPEEEPGVRALVELGDRLYEEFVLLPTSMGWAEWLRVPFRFPRSTRYLNATVHDVVRRHVHDARVEAMYMALFPYIGLPPSRASFVEWAIMMASYLGEGAFYCRGGFQQLADALAAGLAVQGGELIVGRRVNRVHLDAGRVRAVELDGGRLIRAGDVVATGDARETYSSLVGDEHLPARLRRRLGKGELSVGVWEMYLGTDLDLGALGVARETVVYPTWDLDACFRAALGGEAAFVMVTLPTLDDPTLAPTGCHQVVIAGIAPDPATHPDPARLAAGYLRAAEDVVPGLSEHLVHIAGPDGSPSRAMPPWMHHIGEIYGWATTPRQVGAARLPQTTPIPGLTLAGQWTQPGHGVWTVAASGVRAARIVLRRDTDRGLGSPLA